MGDLGCKGIDTDSRPLHHGGAFGFLARFRLTNIIPRKRGSDVILHIAQGARGRPAQIADPLSWFQFHQPPNLPGNHLHSPLQTLWIRKRNIFM